MCYHLLKEDMTGKIPRAQFILFQIDPKFLLILDMGELSKISICSARGIHQDWPPLESMEKKEKITFQYAFFLILKWKFK